MTELDRTWAKTQIEAMADGTLPAEAERRMRALMNCDPGIRSEVEQARFLRGALMEFRGCRPPAALLFRLWRIPDRGRRQRAYWIPVAACATLAAIAIGSGLFFMNAGPTPDELARQEAVQDFALVVAYLQKSTLMASNEVNEAVGTGVRDALAASRGDARQASGESSKGEQDNVD